MTTTTAPTQSPLSALGSQDALTAILLLGGVLNGFVVREGEKLGLSCRANAVLTDLVKRVEKGELKPDPRHITELRLN